MATAQQIKAIMFRRRWPWLVALALLLVLAWFWHPIIGFARTGASVGARVTCSCRYVEGRSLQDCRKDFEDGMGLVSLSDHPDQRSVTARFLILSRQTATYRDGPGCVLEGW